MAREPWTRSSSWAAATVTDWEVVQLSGVKVNVLVDVTVMSESPSPAAMVTVTLAVGLVFSFTP